MNLNFVTKLENKFFAMSFVKRVNKKIKWENLYGQKVTALNSISSQNEIKSNLKIFFNQYGVII